MGQEEEAEAVQLGNWLRAARERARLSQDQAGAQLGVSPKTIGRWERGQHPPSGDTLVKAARLYGADLGEVMSTEDMERAVNVPRGTSMAVTEAGKRYATNGDDSWSPNPALVAKIPRRAYDVAIAYCRRLLAGGWPREEIEQIERLMIDQRYAQANKRKGVELTEDEHIMLIDATWEAVKHTAAALGRQV